jgi:hypothetical protein
MKKEGTGKPQNPDIALDAGVRMHELRFEKVPDPEVCFRGNTGRDSVWKSRRENLPDEVQEDVVYRDAGIRLRIASEIVEGSADRGNSSENEWVITNSDYSGRKPGEQVPEGREKKEKK